MGKQDQEGILETTISQEDHGDLAADSIKLSKKGMINNKGLGGIALYIQKKIDLRNFKGVFGNVSSGSQVPEFYSFLIGEPDAFECEIKFKKERFKFGLSYSKLSLNTANLQMQVFMALQKELPFSSHLDFLNKALRLYVDNGKITTYAQIDKKLHLKEGTIQAAVKKAVEIDARMKTYMPVFNK